MNKEKDQKIKKVKPTSNTSTDADYLVGGIDDTFIQKKRKGKLIED